MGEICSFWLDKIFLGPDTKLSDGDPEEIRKLQLALALCALARAASD
jgi:hypothetical protein